MSEGNMPVRLPVLFIEFWKTFPEYTKSWEELNPWEKAFRKAYEAGHEKKVGSGFVYVMDISNKFVLAHLSMLSDEFSKLCTPRSGNEYTYNEGRSARKVRELLTTLGQTK